MSVLSNFGMELANSREVPGPHAQAQADGEIFDHDQLWVTTRPWSARAWRAA